MAFENDMLDAAKKIRELAADDTLTINVYRYVSITDADGNTSLSRIESYQNVDLANALTDAKAQIAAK